MNERLATAFTLRRGRAPGGSFELYAWLFMRISGLALLGLAIFHLLWMHIAIGVDRIDFDVVARRWANPLWRLYDLLLLVFALLHGMNGLRTIVDDYVRAPGWGAAIRAALFLATVVFVAMGAYIPLSFVPPAPAGAGAP